MEDYLSETYDDVSIRKWAKDIHQMKIRELEEMILALQRGLSVLNVKNNDEIIIWHVAQRNKILNLERKLSILTNKYV